jgi:hypothetical protein
MRSDKQRGAACAGRRALAGVYATPALLPAGPRRALGSYLLYLICLALVHALVA